MAMQGKSTSGDKPSLDADEADQAADAFRPSWDADDSDTSSGGELPFASTMPTVTVLSGSNGGQIVPSQSVIVGSPVIALGSPSNVNETAPFKAQPAPAPAKAPVASTQLGISPASAAVVAAANAAMPSPATRLGGISPEAAAVVAAANAANAAAVRAPAPSTEALDSASVIEVTPSVPQAPMTAPMPNAPTSSAPSMAQAPKATATSSARAAAVTQAPAGKAAPIPFAAADPFRGAAPVIEDDDLFIKKKSSKGIIFAAIGAIAILGAGLYMKFGMGSSDPKPTTPSTVAGTIPASPTNDIPPPPEKDELPSPPPSVAAKTAEPKAAKTAEPKAEPPPAAAKAPEPPKAVAAAPAPRPAKAPPPALPAPAPKTPPKSTGGGIVRDSPF